MARLSNLVFRCSDAVSLPKQRRQRLRCIAHHVSELLEHFLDPHLELADSSQLTVFAGPVPASEHEYFSALGASAVYLPEFNVRQCLEAHPDQSQQLILDAYVTAVSKLLANAGSSQPGLESAAARVRKAGFTLDTETQKLSRSFPDRSARIKIFRCLNNRRGEVWEARVQRKGGTWLKPVLITPDPAFLDRSSHFAASRFANMPARQDSAEQPVYQIIEPRLDRVHFSMNLSSLGREIG